jgi:hypothetical protein
LEIKPKKYSEAKLIAKATTPMILLGIERRIAYANKKYHSGTIWTGLLNLLAAINISASPRTNGNKRAKTKKLPHNTRFNPSLAT